MRVLVTGGAGFIGSHVCRRLCATPDVQVVALDDLSIGLAGNLDGLPVRLVVGSILDEELLRRTMAGVDRVVHLAALPSVPRSLADPLASHAANATGTLLLLQAARAAGVEHVVMASSSSVYGDSDSPVKHEDLPTRPRSPYAASKLAAEAYGLAFAAAFDLDVLAFRFFNIFGPGQRADHPYAAVVPRFVTAALTGSPLEVHGDGKQSRDFTYVGDATRVLRDATLRRVRCAEPVNLAFGRNISLNTIIELLQGMTSRPLTVRHTDPRPGDVRTSRADDTRLRALFPAVVATGFDAALRRTVDWYAAAITG